MNRVLALFLLVPPCVRSEDLYRIHPMSETEIVDTYNSVLRDACRHADQEWTDWPTNSNSGFWGNGHSDERGIRHISAMTLPTAALLKYSSALTENERAEFKRKALAAFRFVAATHVTGSQKCTDGNAWGDAWQSAMWTCDLAFSAWLIWDDLDDGLRGDFERVVAHEADRFLAIRAPAGSFNDTKAEENGWDLTCIALASNMFPEHPHAAAWKKKAIEYMIHTLSAPQDQDDQTLVDGRPVSEWYTGANLHPDFTLENHGFFHPSYVGCSCYFLTEAAYPQGMDWDLHGTPYVSLFAALASYQKDPMAARLEEVYLQYMRAWQEKEKGDLALTGSPYGFGRHAVTAGLAAYAFLAHKIFGPPTKELTASEAALIGQGVSAHDWIEVITQRTGDKFASFSWTNRIMGLVVPIGPGHEGNPDFTAPVTDGFVGEFILGPKDRQKTVVVDHSWKRTTDSFETTGTLLMNEGQLKQTLQMTSLGDKTVVYQDRVMALTNVNVAQEHGVPFGIENDDVNGGTRLLSYKGGQVVFDQRTPRPPTPVPGSWANVNGRLGVITVGGSGMSYDQAKNYAPGISVREDILYSSFRISPRVTEPVTKWPIASRSSLSKSRQKRPRPWPNRSKSRTSSLARSSASKPPRAPKPKSRCSKTNENQG